MQISSVIVVVICSMMGLLICKYESFWQDVSVESLILWWPLRPLGLLFNYQTNIFLIKIVANAALRNGLFLLSLDLQKIECLSSSLETPNIHILNSWTYILKVRGWHTIYIQTRISKFHPSLAMNDAIKWEYRFGTNLYLEKTNRNSHT